MYDKLVKISKNKFLHKNNQLKLIKIKELFQVYLCLNPSLDLEAQHLLMNDSRCYIVEHLARNPSLHRKLQIKIANESWFSAKINLAENKNLDLKARFILEKMNNPWLQRIIEINHVKY